MVKKKSTNPAILPTPKDAKPERESSYVRMLQKPEMDALAHLPYRARPQMDSSGAIAISSRGYKVIFDILLADQPRCVLPVSARKLLDALTHELTKVIDYKGKQVVEGVEVSLNLKEYMELCKKNVTPNSVHDFAKQIREDIKALKKIGPIDYEGKTGWTAFIGYCKLERNGNIVAVFMRDVAALLQYGYQAFYHKKLWELDSKYNNAWAIGRKMCYHHCIDNNWRLGTDNTLSVKSLLEAAIDLPTKEALKQTGGSAPSHIIERFDKALEVLADHGILKEYTYTWANKKPLTKKEYEYMLENYETFIECYVQFSIEEPEELVARRAALAQEEGIKPIEADKPKPSRKPRKARGK